MILGHRMHGSGPNLVVVLHEWLGDSQNWSGVTPYLPEDQFRCLLVDLRGYGMSKQIRGTYTLEEAASDVIALVRRLTGGSFHLVAHSMSALVAQYILAFEKSVSRALLVSPVPPAGFKMNEDAFARLLAVIDDDDAALAAIAARTGSRYGNGWLRRKLATARLSASREAMRGYAHMFTQNDISESVRGVGIPIRVVAGKYDLPVYRADTIRETFGAIYRHLEVVECSEAGHYGVVEAPVFIASEIERFLSVE